MRFPWRIGLFALFRIRQGFLAPSAYSMEKPKIRWLWKPDLTRAQIDYAASLVGGLRATEICSVVHAAKPAAGHSLDNSYTRRKIRRDIAPLLSAAARGWSDDPKRAQLDGNLDRGLWGQARFRTRNTERQAARAAPNPNQALPALSAMTIDRRQRLCSEKISPRSKARGKQARDSLRSFDSPLWRGATSRTCSSEIPN